MRNLPNDGQEDEAEEAGVEIGTVRPFQIRHLRPDQAEALWRQALEQAEAVVLSAWINLVLNPHDAGARATYEQAADRLAALAKEWEKCR